MYISYVVKENNSSLNKEDINNEKIDYSIVELTKGNIKKTAIISHIQSNKKVTYTIKNKLYNNLEGAL
jgi:hypothetical protein